MSKRQIKVGSIIEAGTRDNMVTGKVKLIIGAEGHGKAILYKCEFNSPVSIRNTLICLLLILIFYGI